MGHKFLCDRLDGRAQGLAYLLSFLFIQARRTQRARFILHVLLTLEMPFFRSLNPRLVRLVIHQGLLTLVTCSKTSIVVAEAVVVLRQLLQQNPDFEGARAVVRRLSVLLLQSFLQPADTEGKGGGRPGDHEQSGARASLAQPRARASIIWTLGEYHQHISGVATDVLRVLAKVFPELEEEVKMQVRRECWCCSCC